MFYENKNTKVIFKKDPFQKKSEAFINVSNVSDPDTNLWTVLSIGTHIL